MLHFASVEMNGSQDNFIKQRRKKEYKTFMSCRIEYCSFYD